MITKTSTLSAPKAKANKSAYMKAWRSANRDRIAAYATENAAHLKAARKANREIKTEQYRAYNKAHRAARASTLVVAEKRCSGCGTVRLASEFGQNKSAADGLQEWCKPCRVRARAANAEALKAVKRADYQKNHARYRAKGAAWYEANKGTPEFKAYMAEQCRRRQVSKTKATPAWADRAAMRKVYAEAARLTRETGVPHHVDHIVPITSDIVSGLHVPANLQVLPAPENIAKSNRFWPDMP